MPMRLIFYTVLAIFSNNVQADMYNIWRMIPASYFTNHAISSDIRNDVTRPIQSFAMISNLLDINTMSFKVSWVGKPFPEGVYPVFQISIYEAIKTNEYFNGPFYKPDFTKHPVKVLVGESVNISPISIFPGRELVVDAVMFSAPIHAPFEPHNRYAISIALQSIKYGKEHLPADYVWTWAGHRLINDSLALDVTTGDLISSGRVHHVDIIGIQLFDIRDDDNDGIINEWDDCPTTAQGVVVDDSGCALP